jgi:hypothetical protein
MSRILNFAFKKGFFIQLVDFILADINPLFYRRFKRAQYESFNKIDAPLVINSLQ